MKKYNNPECKIIILACEDIVATSNNFADMVSWDNLEVKQK